MKKRRKIPGTTRYVAAFEEAFVGAAEHGLQQGARRLAHNIAKGLDDRNSRAVILGLSEAEIFALNEVLRATDIPPILEALRDDLADGVSGNSLHLRVRGQG